MVQLSPFPTLDVTPPPEHSEEGEERRGDSVTAGSPKVDLPGGLLGLEASTAYHGYETYIEDGLICLKHKVRNLEKKKLKLEDYKKRLSQGEALNGDQMVAVEKYEEVLHNLAFAHEMHKTLESLTQNLLRGQKKAVKKEQVVKSEVERRRLSTVLQVQHLLHSLQQEHVRRDLLAGHNQAPHIPAQQLHSLSQLSALLGVKRDNRLRLEEQMEQAALAYLDLLEGKEKPVAGSTFKLLKEELTRLLNCKYFSCLPPPPRKSPEVLLSLTSHSTTKSKPNEASKENWKEDFQTMREQEPPDCWDMEFSEGASSPKAAVHKPWRGAAALIPKVPVGTKKQPPECEQKKARKAKGEQCAKSAVNMDMTVEVFNSPSALPKDPILRKQHLEDLMTKIHGSFSFMQDSLLDSEISAMNSHTRLKRQPSRSPSPLGDLEQINKLCNLTRSSSAVACHGALRAQNAGLQDAETSRAFYPCCFYIKTHRDTRVKSQDSFSCENNHESAFNIACFIVDIYPKFDSIIELTYSAHSNLGSPDEVLPKVMHSTPLPTRLMEGKASLTNGDECLETCDLELSSNDLPHEPLQLAEPKKFPSPPLYRREATTSVVLEKSCPRTPVTESGEQSPCNVVTPCTSTTPQGQTFSTPPTRRTLTSAQFRNIHSVFKVNGSLPSNGDLNYKPDSAVFPKPRYSTASTQTPPEFAPSEDEPQQVHQSDYTVGNGGQIFLSPGPSGGSVCRSGQTYYTRGSVRGMARGGKGLAQTFRSSGWHRGSGVASLSCHILAEAWTCMNLDEVVLNTDFYSSGGAYIPQTHFRDSGPLLYATRDSGYQHSFRRGGGRHNSAAWSDSSQVSSPDREAFTIVESGHGDSLSVSTLEVPLTPHGHHHTALLPMQLYPLTQPLRVAFTASRTANFAPGNLDQPIVFDQLHSNLGETYNTHIGRFTCPANGSYVFIFHILKLAINVPLYINLMRNEEVMVSAYANDGAPDHETASNHAILPLFQGDQVWLRLHRGAIYGSTWKYSTFSGFLLYQD